MWCTVIYYVNKYNLYLVILTNLWFRNMTRIKNLTTLSFLDLASSPGSFWYFRLTAWICINEPFFPTFMDLLPALMLISGATSPLLTAISSWIVGIFRTRLYDFVSGCMTLAGPRPLPSSASVSIRRYFCWDKLIEESKTKTDRSVTTLMESIAVTLENC